jgi:sugar O-acyltransferase (sialic acid O-acetyltransferase NeuD family)
MKLFLWGAGGHAKVVADAARLCGRWTLAGFLDDVHPERAGEAFYGGRVLGGRDMLPHLRTDPALEGIVAVGDCHVRLSLSEVLRDNGFPLATVIHPAAVIADSVRVGWGTFIAAAAVAGPDCQLGESVILNTAASVDHDCVVEAGAHVGPGACLAGRVRVGRATLVGAGAVVIPGVQIGANCVIGAGAVVVSDVPSGSIARGNPARVVQENA